VKWRSESDNRANTKAQLHRFVALELVSELHKSLSVLWALLGRGTGAPVRQRRVCDRRTFNGPGRTPAAGWSPSWHARAATLL